MGFKPPGYYLGFLSIMWIVAGSFMTYMYAQNGERALAAFYSVFVVCAIPFWFDIRGIAIPWMIFLGIATLFHIYGLFQPGPWMKALGRLAIAASSLQAVWEWYSAPEDDESPAE